ncbi:hypothetical protein D3C84_1236790 [compost metagenome]
MYGRYVGGFKGVGQHAHRHPGIGPAGEVNHSRLAGHEVRRNHDQLFADTRKFGRQLRGQ